jgi:hypothetical protein
MLVSEDDRYCPWIGFVKSFYLASTIHEITLSQHEKTFRVDSWMVRTLD